MNDIEPDFVFLSEPMLFQCDLKHEMTMFDHKYSASLNSDDAFDSDLQLLHHTAKGGTMAMWKHDLDPFVSSLPAISSSFHTIIFTPPRSAPSIHITLYLPTAGREDPFIEATVQLYDHILDLTNRFPDYSLFVRGDANVNSKNCKRLRILNSICSKFNLIRKEIGHKTYHHFVGKGMSDSELDVLIYKIPSEEQLLKVYCIHENPLMTSHHDALMSCFFLPVVQHTPKIDDLPRALVLTTNVLEYIGQRMGSRISLT